MGVIDRSEVGHRAVPKLSTGIGCFAESFAYGFEGESIPIAELQDLSVVVGE